MLDKKIIEKIEKYNKKRHEVDKLQREIESILYDKYYIDDSLINSPYKMEGACPIYEWGTEIFDLEMLEKIVLFLETFEKATGEFPDYREITRKFEE